MAFEGWTEAEKLQHERGRALMQSARDTRRNRIEAEKAAAEREKARQAAAQRAADEAAQKLWDDRVRDFMSDFSGLLNKYQLTLMTIQTISSWGQKDLPIFKLAMRDAYKAPEYLVNVRPGVGFNWKK